MFPVFWVVGSGYGGHRQDEAGSHPFGVTIDSLRYAVDGVDPAEGLFNPISVFDRQGIALMSGGAPVDR